MLLNGCLRAERACMASTMVKATTEVKASLSFVNKLLLYV